MNRTADSRPPLDRAIVYCGHRDATAARKLKAARAAMEEELKRSMKRVDFIARALSTTAAEEDSLAAARRDILIRLGGGASRASAGAIFDVRGTPV